MDAEVEGSKPSRHPFVFKEWGMSLSENVHIPVGPEKFIEVSDISFLSGGLNYFFSRVGI